MAKVHPALLHRVAVDGSGAVQPYQDDLADIARASCQPAKIASQATTARAFHHYPLA